MRHRTKILLATTACVVALGAAAAFAAPAIYRGLFATPAAEAPTLTLDESALDPTAGEILDPAELTGTWRVTEGSEAGYRVDEVLNGADVTVTGRTAEVSGALTADGLTITEASLVVDVASITTDSSSRDRYFRDSALRTADHPEASFELTEPAVADEAPTSGEALEQQLTGDLTIAGTTRPVTFTAQMRTDGDTAEVAGRIPIVFEDFGVAAPSLGFVKVEPEGFVEFQLVLVRE